MSQLNRCDERISALVDEETHPGETRRMIDALLEEDELRERWERYHLIREVLRQEKPMLADTDFVSRVMQGVEEESLQSPPASRWGKPLWSLALAASIVGLMALGLQAIMSPPGMALRGKQEHAMLAVKGSGLYVDPGHHVPTQLESYMRLHANPLSNDGLPKSGRLLAYVYHPVTDNAP